MAYFATQEIMLSETSMNAFRSLCAGIEYEHLKMYQDAAGIVQAEALSRGAYQSSSTCIQLDRQARLVLESAAGKVYDALNAAVNVEPNDRVIASAEQLKDRYSSELMRVGKKVIACRDSLVSKISPQTMEHLKEASEGLNQAKDTHLARIDLLIQGMRTHGQSMQTINNTFHIGTAGAVQTGPNANAFVTQSSGGNEAVLQALQEIATALRSAKGLQATDRDDAVQLITEIEGEVRSAAPNRARIKANLSAVKGAVEVLAAVGPAWKQVQEWGNLIIESMK